MIPCSMIRRKIIMTLNECYEAMGANYQEVQGRLRTDERISRFLMKFPRDPSYEQLCDAMAKKDAPEAFRASHTLKGVSQNLSLTQLYRSADTLCEALRGKDSFEPSCEPLFETVKENYATVIDCIAKLS
jgi:hypothetical protein